MQSNNLIDKSEIHLIIKNFEEKINLFQKIMDGENLDLPPRNPAFFPLIEFGKSEEQNFGIMDSASALIKDSNNKTHFHIMPSETEIEQRIKDQVERSWKTAVEYSKNINKLIKDRHEVFISFEAREGFYVGSSLGISLTISFIEEILRFYNSSVIVDIKDRVAFTGGVEIDGNIPALGDKLIKQKCESVFFTAARNFVIPAKDGAAAKDKLEELKKSISEEKSRNHSG